jgi:hypothetical protein
MTASRGDRQTPPDGRRLECYRGRGRRRSFGHHDEDVPAELAGAQGVGVAVVDLDRQHLGERGVELARLILDRGLLVVLAGCDLGDVEVVAHTGLVQMRRRMPRVLL